VRDLTELDKYRIMTMDDLTPAPRFEGRFKFGELMVIASAANGWDHMSVCCHDRCPTWSEMDHMKRTFFLPGEVAYQLHVAETDHINIHPHVLHIWRPRHRLIPLPPKAMV
jgi:hypothetical protein